MIEFDETSKLSLRAEGFVPSATSPEVWVRRDIFDAGLTSLKQELVAMAESVEKPLKGHAGA